MSTLYLGFAYVVYAIVLVLVVGWRNMGALEWTGTAGGPVLIYLVRTITTVIFEYRIDGLNSKLKSQQTERAKTIQKLKEATRYDSTLELLEKYGGADNKSKKGKKKGDDNDGPGDGEKAPGKQVRMPNRTNMPPPPTANIQRPSTPAPGTPQPGLRSSVGTPQPGPRSSAGTPRLSSHQAEIDASAEFAPNAFDGKGPPPYMQYPPATTKSAESHWYDRILDTLLGEDETAAKNRIVMICGRCRPWRGHPVRRALPGRSVYPRPSLHSPHRTPCISRTPPRKGSLFPEEPVRSPADSFWARQGNEAE